MYAKISNNQVIDYPVNPNLENPSVSIPNDWMGGVINNSEYVYVSPTTEPQANLGWKIIETAPIFDNGTWKQSWETKLAPKEELKGIVTLKRYQVETSGVIVDNKKYSTDRESQTKYIAVALEISQSNTETYSIVWKTEDSTFVTLNASQMLQVISKIRDHIQSCYNKESEYYNLIDTANSSVLESTDFSAGWPSNN